jgi:hypothetical protein
MMRSLGSVPIAENWSAYLATCSALFFAIDISMLVEISNHCNSTRPAVVPETYVPGHGDLQTKADIQKRLKDAEERVAKNKQLIAQGKSLEDVVHLFTTFRIVSLLTPVHSWASRWEIGLGIWLG